ncbi:MAG: hypothetical protein M0Z38_09370 [Deltaproteobacteria bacterium]|nr:hypothetical protein [Deltaproteobacteria bacterium]
MKPVSVYRVDYVKKSKVRLGTVVERRRKERGGNLLGLLHLARITFASSPQEAFLTTLDWQEARLATGMGGLSLSPR